MNDKVTVKTALLIAIVALIVGVLAMRDDALKGGNGTPTPSTGSYSPTVARYPDCLDMGYPCVDRPDTGVPTLHFDNEVMVVTVVSSSPDPDGVLWHTIQR